MPDDSSTPPADPSPQQATDGQGTQAQPSEPVSGPEPVSEAPAEPPPQAEAVPAQEPQPEVAADAPAPESEPHTPELNTETPQSTSPAPQAMQAVAPTSIIGELLVKARAKIQARRRKKLDRIMDKLTGVMCRVYL